VLATELATRDDDCIRPSMTNVPETTADPSA
jgi:hypothetical protein